MIIKKKEIVENLLSAIHTRTEEYLKELDILPIGSKSSHITSKKVKLNASSVIISIVGEIDISFIISYDDILLKISEQFLENEKYDDDEKDEMLESLAMEFANIVVGNALSKFDKTINFNIRAPLYIGQAKYLSCSKNSIIFASSIITKYGKLLLQCAYIVKTKNKE